MAKVISVVTILVTVRVTLTYLGPERYGLWMGIASLTAMLTFADLGLGNGLLNALAKAHGKEDRDAASRYVSSAFYMLLALAVFLSALLVMIYPLIPWARVFNVSSVQAVAEAGPAAATLVACFLVNLPIGIVQRIQIGYQEGFVSSIWSAVGSLLALCATLLAVSSGAGLPWLVLAVSGAPTISLMLNGIRLFGTNRPWLLPRWELSSMKTARSLLRVGVLFFSLQVAGAMAFGLDNIIVAHVMGAEAVAQYSVPMQMFSLVLVMFSIAMTPLWPAYGEARARGDMKWIERTLVISLIMTVGSAAFASLVLVAFGGQIVSLWVGPTVTPTLPLLIGMGVWATMGSAGSTLAIFLNGTGAIGFQVATAAALAVSAVIVKVLLGQSFGLPGIIWGTVIAYTFCTAIPMAIYVPRMLSAMRSQAAATWLID